MRTSIAALVAALLLTSPLAASAQQAPDYSNAGDYDNGGDAQIRGRIVDFDGGYSVAVRDDRGYIDNVQLHPGTIINPTGIRLEPGMVVSILGYNDGSSFAANEVDTPYTNYSGTVTYQGRPWNAYGTNVGLSVFFGNAGWWHGNAFNNGTYRYNNGVRVYSNVQLNNVYRGGNYQGRAYSAPPDRGGYYPNGSQSGRDNDRYDNDHGNNGNNGANNGRGYGNGTNGNYNGNNGNNGNNGRSDNGDRN